MFLKQIRVVFPAIFCSLLFAEPSAFEMQSGATKKDIRSLKDSAINLSSIMTDLQSRVETLEQVQHGLQSLYDGQNQKLQKLLLDMENHTLSIEEIQARLEIFKEGLNQVKEEQKNLYQEQQKFLALFEGVDQKIRELSTITTNLNASVLKDFDHLIQELKKQADIVLLNQDNIQKLGLEIEKLYIEKKKEQERTAFKQSEKKSEILKEAKRLYQEKQYSQAQDRLVYLIQQNYKKAESNYYLGQIAYIQKHYEDAIFYYKESATLDDKATYMPTLLFKTSEAFKALKDQKNASQFIQTLLALYPQSKEAKEIKKTNETEKSQTQNKGEKKNGK